MGPLPLPPLSPSKTAYQDQITNPFWEVDGRAGYYARIDWQTPWPVSVNLFRYDNRGDRLSSYDLQTAWRTRFWNAGAMASLGARTVAKAQVLWGNTQVGPQTPYGYPADVDFAAAYLLLSREFGGGKLTARGDWFKTHDNSFVASDNNNEHGWSTMLAYKHPLTHFADAIVELLHVESDRPARVTNAAIAAEQNQTQLQTSRRLGFDAMSDLSRLLLAFAALGLGLTGAAQARDITVLVKDAGGHPVEDAVAILDTPGRAPPPGHFRIDQKHTMFAPFVLVVPVGSTIQFTNRDPFRHHVYSFSPAKTFELAVRRAGALVVFDKPGVVALGCNIHDTMQAFVQVVATPFAAKTARMAGRCCRGVPRRR